MDNTWQIDLDLAGYEGERDLASLIESCGGVLLEGMPEAWSACVFRGTTCVEGTTPTEAVARLWIALNAKQKVI